MSELQLTPNNRSFGQKLKDFFAPQDMTQGKTATCLIQFALPLLIGNVIQQMYSTVDSIVVGKYVGDGALAAVGASFPISNLLLVLFMGVSTGAGILVSQFFGARQKERLAKTIGNTLTLTLIISIFISLVGIFFSYPILKMLKTPDDIIEDSAIYMKIIFIGTLGSTYYNIITGILRGLGDSFRPLIYLAIACLLNIVLDLLFVAGFKMGVAGVAWATIIAQLISSLFCFFRIWKMRHELELHPSVLKLEKGLVMDIIKLGIPAGLTQAVFSLASIVVQALTNSFGSLVIAASVMVMRVDGFAMMPNFTFGMAMTTYAGQNVGANRIDRVEEGTKSGLILSVGVSVTLTLIILFFGKNLLYLFTNTPEVISMGFTMLKILAVGYIAMAVTQTLSGVMRGAGDTLTPMWISFITTVVLRVPIAYIIAWLTRSPEMPVGNYRCLQISLLVSWILGAAITAYFFVRGRWRKTAAAYSIQEAPASGTEAAE